MGTSSTPKWASKPSSNNMRSCIFRLLSFDHPVCCLLPSIALICFRPPFSFPPKDEINYFIQWSENHYSSFALSFVAQTCAAKCGRLGISPIYFFLASFCYNGSESCWPHPVCVVSKLMCTEMQGVVWQNEFRIVKYLSVVDKHSFRLHTFFEVFPIF